MPGAARAPARPESVNTVHARYGPPMLSGTPSRPATARARRAGTAAAVAVLALGLAACGSDDDGDAGTTVAADAQTAPGATTQAAPAPAAGTEESRAAVVVTQYLQAFSAGDGRKVCRLFTPEQRARIAKAADDTCAEGIEVAFQQGGGEDSFQRSLGNVRVGETTISGRSATVRLVALQSGTSADALEVRLTRTGKRWLISRQAAG